MNKNNRVFIGSMLFVPVLHYIIFTVYVNYQTVINSFKRWNAYTGNIDFVAFLNYKNVIEEIFDKKEIQFAVRNTLLWIPLNILVLIPLSFFVAYALHKKIRFSKFYRVVYFFPSIISIVVITMVFSFMLNPNIGIVNATLDIVGLESLKRTWLGDPSTALGSVFFFCIWAGIGFNNVIIGGAISRIPKSLFEVGQVLGITPIREMLQVVLPLVWPTISTLIILGASSSFAIFLQSKLLTNGGPNFETNTVALQIVKYVIDGNYGVGSAFGILLAIVGASVTIIIKKIIDLKETVEY
jgi:ABC-type sugar transport system permease subunit